MALLDFGLISTLMKNTNKILSVRTFSTHCAFCYFWLVEVKGNSFYYPVILCTFVLFFVYLALPRIVLNILSSTERTPGHIVMRYADLM